jgi:hypothetical protein
MGRYYPDGYLETVEKKRVEGTHVKLILKQTIQLSDGTSYDIFIGTAPYKNGFVIGDLSMAYSGHLQKFEMADINIKNFSPSCINYLTLRHEAKIGIYDFQRFIIGFKKLNNTIYWGETPTPYDEDKITKVFLNPLDLKYLQNMLKKETEEFKNEFKIS